MAFRFSDLGATVATDPARASIKLASLFAKTPELTKVAKKCSVHVQTLKRWLATIRAAGVPDPREHTDKVKRADRFDASACYSELRPLFVRGLTQSEVAEELGVSRATIIRRIAKCIEHGHDDPRATQS